jgi:hypothetical protein
MKGDIGRQVGRLNKKVLILLTAILLISPISASVLCIAPGSHVAIEELIAECCASSTISTQKDHHPGNGLIAATDCLDCTDFFISPYERGRISESYAIAIAGSLADECFPDRFFVTPSSPIFRQSALDDVAMSPPASYSVSLRC